MLGGVPRTNITKLHEIIAATRDFNWLSLWQNHNPSLLTGDRRQSPEPRIHGAEAYWNRFNTASPESWVPHPFEIHEPEEESHILDHSFLSAGAIYARAGLDFSETEGNGVRYWEATHRSHGCSVHGYTLADFGIQSSDIDARFGRYRAFFADRFASPEGTATSAQRSGVA